jgi:hypothetical protein
MVVPDGPAHHPVPEMDPLTPWELPHTLSTLGGALTPNATLNAVTVAERLQSNPMNRHSFFAFPDV